jgi:hypothetical protein
MQPSTSVCVTRIERRDVLFATGSRRQAGPLSLGRQTRFGHQGQVALPHLPWSRDPATVSIDKIFFLDAFSRGLEQRDAVMH